MELKPGHRAHAGPKGDRLQMRISEARRERYEMAAEAQGKTLTEFVLDAADAEAEHALADRRTFPLDDAAWRAFNEQLEAPPRELPGLADLVKRTDVFRRGA